MTPIIKTRSLATHLSCSGCNKSYNIEDVQFYATCCNKPLVTNYAVTDSLKKTDFKNRVNSMWRYTEMLPLFDPAYRITLGEGMTPMLPVERLSLEYGFGDLWLKDEGLNPTGSFKARGLSMAVSKAKELGITECVIPTAGNAGGAMSAYCSAAGIKATVIMPQKTPLVFQEECRHYGSKLILVNGLIDKCGEMAAKIKAETGAFDMSTLKEPYRLEGKKTMGYEIAEQMDWQLPDVILYPTGGGTGLIGIWKAFQEMVAMGWLTPGELPRMVAVQVESCSPIADAVNGKTVHPASYTMSIANGLSVPRAFGQNMIMETLRQSEGHALTVTDDEIREGFKEISRKEGILIAPEGAAIWQGLKKLVAAGKVQKHERILLLNTGSGYKYLDNYRD